MEEEELMRFIALTLVALLLVGCGTTPRQIEISAKPIDKPNLVLPPVEQLRLKDVEWIVITQDNYQEVFEKLLKDKKDPALIGLTDDGYETLSLNMSDIMRLLQQQKSIIAAYQNYYEDSEKALENANAEIKGAQAEVEAQNSAPQESTLDKLNPFK